MEDPGLFPGMVHFAVLAVIGSLALSATRAHRATLGFQVKLFLCAFTLRFAAAIAIYHFGLVAVLKDEDGSGWQVGAALCREWEQHGVGLLGLPGVWLGAYEQFHRGYFYLVGTLFYVTGSPARLPAAALNCFFGALTVVLAYRVSRTLFSPFVARRVGLWTCVFPSLVIWSAQTIKEPVVIFLEALVIYGAVQARVGRLSVRHVLLSGAAIAFLVPFRLYAAGVAGLAFAVSLLLPVAHPSRRSIAIFRIVGPVALYALISAVLAQRQAEVERVDLQYLQSFREAVTANQGSGVRVGHDLTSPSGLVSSLAVGGLHLLLAPFPWQLTGGGARLLLVGPEMVVWWLLFFRGLLPGFVYAIRTGLPRILPVLMFLVPLAIFYSLTFGNIGLAYRQRAQLMPWLLMFAAVGLERTARRPIGPSSLRRFRDVSPMDVSLALKGRRY